jgi:hypothetical protein
MEVREALLRMIVQEQGGKLMTLLKIDVLRNK